ncbi:MAG: MaoC family dehydratase N-terminal domain-containing protein [Hyphomicrobiales bacterium]|nr:MaoC family dehydratase N-terminal domain-containing protein [Hyphomicrobiales bacterium]
MSVTEALKSLEIGDTIPDLVTDPITHDQLARFAAASGDHNPIHLDEDAAKAGGLPGIIAHGMLNMAALGLVLTGWVPQSAVRRFSARFVAMTFPGDTLTLSGTITGRAAEAGEDQVTLDLEARNQKGETILKGAATIAL